MDPKAMEEMMAKLAAPGPQHRALQEAGGRLEPDREVDLGSVAADAVSNSTATITTLMDGRYCQEPVERRDDGEAVPGMGLTGYDNVLKKYEVGMDRQRGHRDHDERGHAGRERQRRELDGRGLGSHDRQAGEDAAW
jgi:hypothetical protein